MASSIAKTYEARALSEIADYTYNLCLYVIALSIELNVVIITASISMLRPLFQRRIPTPIPAVWQTHIPLRSALSSKDRSRSNTVRLPSISSLEGMEAQRNQSPNGHGIVIQVDTEVEITYQMLEAPYVHAALVGLIQGEILNPQLVQR